MISSRAKSQPIPHPAGRDAAGGSGPLPQFILTHEGDLLGQDTLETREIVRRIHACVSACEGISTDELERGIVTDMRRVIAEVAPVLQQRVRG